MNGKNKKILLNDHEIFNNINNLPHIRGLIVIHMVEKYYNNSNMNQSFNIWSVTAIYQHPMEYILDEEVML